MRHSLRQLFVLISVAATVLGLAPRLRGEDEAVVVIVHPGVRLTTLSIDELVAIFTMSERAWTGGQTIIPFNYEPSTTLRDRFDRAVLSMNPDEVGRFWIDRRIRGAGDAPRWVPSVTLMLRVVGKVPGAIGYVPASAVTRDVRIVARISGGKVQPVGGG